MKDCQIGEDGETPCLAFENGDQLEAGLLVKHQNTFFRKIFEGSRIQKTDHQTTYCPNENSVGSNTEHSNS